MEASRTKPLCRIVVLRDGMLKNRKRLVNGFPPQARMSGLACSRKRLPVMRKQFVDSVNRVLGDA